MTVQLVCFDIGGVLIRIVQDWHEAFQLAGLAAPDAPDAPDFAGAARANQDGEAEFARAARAYETGKTDDETFLQAMMRRLPGLTVPQARQIMRVWLIEPFAGVDDVIAQVNQTTTVTACLSNTNLLHWRQMEDDPRYGPLLRRLDQHFTSFDMGTRKPEPEIYEQVESTMGLPPERILFFDDLEDNIAAARARGWQAHRIDPQADPASQMRKHLQYHNVINP